LNTALSIGWAKKEITPPFETPLAGFVRRGEKSTNIVADPLFVRCLILRSEQIQAVLFVYDLLGFNESVGNALRETIVQETGFNSAQIILSCTHTHSAPPTIELTKCGKINPVYVELLKEKSIKVVRQALRRDQPVNCLFNRFHLPDLSVNRRDASQVTNDNISVLQFNKGRSTLGVLVHFSAHPNSVCEDRISADYPGYVCRRLEQELGIPFSMFVLGTAGDTNLLVNEYSYSEMERFGSEIFEAVKSALDVGQPVEVRNLEVLERELPLELTPHTKTGRLEKKIKAINEFIVDFIKSRGKHPHKGALYRKISWILLKKDLIGVDPDTVHFVALALLENNQHYLSALSRNDRSSVRLRVQFLLLDDLIFIFVGAELFAHIFLELEQKFPGKKVLLCGYLDPLLGYIAPEEEYKRGGYEVDEAFLFYGAGLPFAKNTEQTLIAYLSEQLSELYARENGPNKRELKLL